MSVVAYHFWSPTCEPCKAIKPSVETLKEDFEQVEWISVNTHADPQNFAGQLRVQVVPTIVVMVRDANGTLRESGRHSGTAMAQYYRILRTATRS